MKFSEVLAYLEDGRRARLPWMGEAPNQRGRYSIARDGDDFRFENGTTCELDAEDCLADDWELVEAIVGAYVREPTPAETVHFCGIYCYATGCNIGGIDPPVPRPWLTIRSTSTGPGLASGLALEKMVAEQDRGIFPKAAAAEIAEALYGKIPALDKSVWEFTPGQQAGTLRIVASPLMPEGFFALGTLPSEGGTVPPPDHRTKSDRHGSYSRDDVPDSMAGCRLGCACSVHKPVKPAPWVPSVGDFDLLPEG